MEVREAQSVNGPLAILNEYYGVYVTQPEDAKWRLDNMHETYLQDMNSKYVYPNVFMSIDDTNKVSQYDTDIKKYAEQKKADWILNGGIDEEWDSYLKKMEKYGLSDYLSIKQKYFDQYQDSLSSENKRRYHFDRRNYMSEMLERQENNEFIQGQQIKEEGKTSLSYNSLCWLDE